ncbi:MAG: BT4734/BF3469 family protein [Limisphaerales bacterium]
MNNTAPPAEPQAPVVLQPPTAPPAPRAAGPPSPAASAPLVSLPENAPAINATRTDTPAPNGEQPTGSLIEYRGLRVITGSTYDLERKISVGTARGNDIKRVVTVREALEYMRGEKSLKKVELARLAQKEMAVHMEEILWSARTTGDLFVEQDDPCFLPSDEKRMGFQGYKDLVSAITKIYQDFTLEKMDSWADAAKVSAARGKMLELAWRMAKAQCLPGWTFAGAFSLRTISNLLTSAGLMPLDFDHVADVAALVAKLTADPLFFFTAKSPSLTGVKSAVRIPDDAAKDPKVYLRCFEMVEKYVKQNYPEATLGVDKQAKAVSQLMFYLHDPDAYCREDSYILLPDRQTGEDAPKRKTTNTSNRGEQPKPGQRPKAVFAFDKYPPEKQWEVVKSATDALIDNLDKVPSGPGDRNGFWTRLGYAYRDWLKDVEVESLVNDARSYLLALAEQHYGGGTQPVQNALDSSGGSCGLGTLFKFARDYAGWVPPWKPEAADDALILPGGGVTIKESAKVIFERIAPTNTIFSRGNALVEIVRDSEGRPRLELITPEGFRSRVEKFGTIMAWRVNKEGDTELRQVVMPRDCASALMASAEAREILPPIAGILRCPLLIDLDGKPTILGDGYHHCLGGVYVECGQGPPEMSLEDAKVVLLRVIEDFDFQAPGDKSRAVAAMLTPALRLGGWLHDSVPMDVSEADESQAGKGYRHKLVCAFYNEKPNYVAKTQGGVGSVDERLAETLAEGKPFVTYDNVRGLVDSQYLESLLTSNGPFPARVPHHGSMMVDSRHFLIQLSSNGAAMTRDLANRCVITRIRKRKRGYGYWDILGAVVDDYLLCLGAVFRVIQEWVANGKPRTTESRHDFREWCQTLDWIVQKVLGCAPLMEGHDEAQERVGDPLKVWVRDVMLALAKRGQLGEALTAAKIVQVCDEQPLTIPGLKSDREDSAARWVGRILARVFGTGDVVTMEGFELERISEKDDCGHASTLYVLTRMASGTRQDRTHKNDLNTP